MLISQYPMFDANQAKWLLIADIKNRFGTYHPHIYSIITGRGIMDDFGDFILIGGLN